MSARVQNQIAGRLSLRPPQAESLTRLIMALQAAPEMLQKQRSLDAILATLKAQFASLEDFEREFPSLCFALATGVGKTRLMGAFIAYLHLAHGINNFFVLAPNLTIYNKLIGDFTPNSPKYVFKGIAEFAVNAPDIITGDNYDQRNHGADGLFGGVRINIFNISKINSEVRGGREPRIKRMKEVLGDSYFNYLASLPDLVLLMDESHRYRAQAGMRSINELNPLFGLELTATPFTESARGPVPFKNVIVDYPLARAMEDGFVKEPAVVTQRNFNSSNHSSEDIEKIKLEDGIRLHENTKAELLTYAHENSVPVVKPFMLVIARDTTHAGLLLALLESDAFYGGRYQGKVIQVDSSKTGAEEEQMVSRLLAVESSYEPTEIVIHVNMLKEGWDVTNLYTIVPLRAANARTLIEQSIGRGLRLPYGKRTGIEAVDRLSIVAHDKFQEIIDEANRGDSPIRLKQIILEAPSPDDAKTSIQVEAGINALLGISLPSSLQPDGHYAMSPAASPMFVTEPERVAAQVVIDVVRSFEAQPERVPSSQALLKPEIQAAIFAAVQERLKTKPSELSVDDKLLDLSALVQKATQTIAQQTIDIPRIAVVPSGNVSTGFHPFKLGTLPNFQPGQREIVGQILRTGQQFTHSRESSAREERFEDYIVNKLVDFDDVDYFTHSDLLYDLAGQAVSHYRAQSYSVNELHEIFDAYGGELAKLIHAEMMKHFWEKASSYEIQVSRGFSELKPCSYTVTAGQSPKNYRETVTELGKIKQMIFGGFQRCLYPLQKFDSDTERRFAAILEREADKWFKPNKGQFQIFYKLVTDHSEYIPDFVAETESCIYMIETKAKGDVESAEVQAKAEAASQWCKNASDYSTGVGGKSWKYLLVPHDVVDDSKRLIDFLQHQKM